MDKLDFLDGAEAPIEEAVVETPVAEAPAEAPAETSEATPEAKPDRPRGPDGKFAKKEAEEPVMVPLKALHETRDEVKALRAQLEAATTPQQTQPKAVPDIFEDPQGYQDHIASTTQQAVLNATLNLSEELTRQAAGGEVVDAAQQWGAQAFQQNPALWQQFISQRNPYGFLVQEYQRQTALIKLGDPSEIDAFLAWKAAQASIQPAATPQPQPNVPISIASAPSAGGVAHIATGPGVAFSETIK